MSEVEERCLDYQNDDYTQKCEFEYLCSEQIKLSPYTKNYKIIFSRRHIIIDYFVDLHDKLCTENKTLLMAISLFDNFMSIIDTKQEKELFNVVKITKISLIAFYVAYKYEESFTLTIEMIQKYFIKSQSVFEKDEFLRLEILFLKTLNFKLYNVNLHSFHECFYDYLFLHEINRADEDIDYKNFVTDLMKLNGNVLTIISNLKEIMFASDNCINFASLKISQLAVVSLKISILFFDSGLELQHKKLKKMNMIMTEFFSIGYSEKVNLNRCASNLFFLIKDLMKKEDRKVYKGLRKICQELNLSV